MQDFRNAQPDPNPARVVHNLENALMAAALMQASEEGTDTRKELHSRWFYGVFSAAAYGLTSIPEGYGLLEWAPDRDGFRLLWTSPTGLTCPLARLYPQENGTWAAMVVAGVKDDLAEAMAQAEWAVSRLTI